MLDHPYANSAVIAFAALGLVVALGQWKQISLQYWRFLLWLVPNPGVPITGGATAKENAPESVPSKGLLIRAARWSCTVRPEACADVTEQLKALADGVEHFELRANDDAGWGDVCAKHDGERHPKRLIVDFAYRNQATLESGHGVIIPYQPSLTKMAQIASGVTTEDVTTIQTAILTKIFSGEADMLMTSLEEVRKGYRVKGFSLDIPLIATIPAAAARDQEQYMQYLQFRYLYQYHLQRLRSWLPEFNDDLITAGLPSSKPYDTVKKNLASHSEELAKRAKELMATVSEVEPAV